MALGLCRRAKPVVGVQEYLTRGCPYFDPAGFTKIGTRVALVPVFE